jgi:cyclopropane fatty-acyl-phospholipid synthase-like methyltransferase
MGDDGAMAGMPGAVRPRRPEDFDALYAVTPAWDIGRPQPALQAVAASGEVRGEVLDVGCGTGEHALMAAALGLDATGVDAARAAIAGAEAKARERGLPARFIVANVLDLPSLGLRVDTVLDSAMFHVLADEDRGRYVESLRAVLRPEGRYFLLCFSEREPGDWGPRRVTRDEIRHHFATGWRVDSIEPAEFHLTVGRLRAQAWLAALTRV